MKPEAVFPKRTKAISITGSYCALMCKHCCGHYLKSMAGANSIPAICKDTQVRSVLLSGGCDENGEVPILKFKDEILALRKSGKRILAHTGLLNPKKAQKLRGLVDAVSFNFIGCCETINEVYGIRAGVDDFIESYLAIRKNVRIVPHITIGLRGGAIKDEERALELLNSLGERTIVINVFVPSPKTPYEGRNPPNISEALCIVKKARDLFDRVYIGCMRPGGRYRQIFDTAIFESEMADRITLPHPKVRIDGDVIDECCAL